MNKLLSLFLIATFFLAACGGAAPTTAPQATGPTVRTPSATKAPPLEATPTEDILQGTVTLWHSWDELEVPTLVQIIKDFQAQYPDVQFDVLYVPFENLLPRYETSALDGGGPALLLGPAEWGPPLYDEGLVSDLTEMAASDFLNSLNPAALEAANYQEAIISLPYTLQGVVLYRNKSIIPEVPATFDDLVSLAKSVTQGDVIGADLERSFFYSGAHLNGVEGTLMQPDGAPAFNDENGVAWVEMLRAFETAGSTEFQSDNDLDLFRQGRVGFIIDATWNKDNLAEAIGADNLGIDPWPAYENGYLSGYVQSDNLFLSTQAAGDNRRAAWEFARYFVSPEAQLKLAEIGRIPASSQVEVIEPLMAQAILALEGGTAYPVIPQMSFYAAPMDTALKSVFEQGVQPADALQYAMTAILDAMTGIEVTPTP